jgi:hypothetical protein
MAHLLRHIATVSSVYSTYVMLQFLLIQARNTVDSTDIAGCTLCGGRASGDVGGVDRVSRLDQEKLQHDISTVNGTLQKDSTDIAGCTLCGGSIGELDTG